MHMTMTEEAVHDCHHPEIHSQVGVVSAAAAASTSVSSTKSDHEVYVWIAKLSLQ